MATRILFPGTLLLAPAALTAAPVADGRIVYGINTTTPNNRAYTATTNVFAAAAATQAGAVPTFVVDRAAPTRNEHVAGYVTTGGVLYIYRWDGAAWINETAPAGGWGGTVTVGGNGVDGRRFDIAYESTSGNAMVVYSNNSAGVDELRYRIWNGISWTAATNLNSARLTGTPNFIKLSARMTAGSNELAATLADTNSILTTLIWSGSAWGNEPGTAHGTLAGPAGQNDLFDQAYESLSGDLLVIFTTSAPQQNHRSYTAGSWDAAATSWGTARAAPLQMVAAADPGSDQIVCAFNRNGSNNVYGKIWSGTAISGTTTVGSVGAVGAQPAINQRTVTAGWIRTGTTSVGVVMWGSTTTTIVDYGFYDAVAAAWTTAQSWTLTGAPGLKRWMDTAVDPLSGDTLMLTFSDANNDLWAKRLVLTAGPTLTWTNADGGTALTTALTNVTTQNFSFAYDRLGRADLAIVKTDSPDPAAVGQNVTYTLTVSNAGPQSATNVTATDDLLPSGMSYVSATPSQGTCSGTSTVTCILGTITSGANATIQIVVTPTSTGVKTNTASVTASQTDPNLANNQDSETTTVNPASADLSVAKTAPSPVYSGDSFSYTLTVSNSGPSPATNVTVTDTLPAGTVFWSAIPSQGSCSGSSTVSCNLGSIASGGSATVTIVVQATALGTLSNTASATATESDPDLANNSSTVSTTVLQINTADVSITKAGSPASVAVGANVTYTLTVTNGGPDAANGVTVTDPVPAGMTLVSATTTLGSCSGTLTVTCTLGSMTNAATATITIVATVNAGGTKSNTAIVGVDTTTTFDPNAPNNLATATTAVTGGTGPVCIPNSIGPGGTLSGIPNTYYPGTVSVAAGATSITLGQGQPAGATAINSGDLVLVIQMQDAQINSTNTDCYGAGAGCLNTINGTGPGAGAIAGTVNAGKYEFVRATNSVVLGGGILTLAGAGAGGGLVNSYTDANATTTKGQARFQVVRGLEFTSATLSSATPVTAAVWTTDANGRGTGGILALDVAGTLTMGSGVLASVDGLGFRGAAGRMLTGEAGTCSTPTITPNGQDWRGPTGTGSANPCDTHGGKGEGNAGTPEYVYNPSGAHTCGSATNTYIVNTNQPNDGYPNGSMARGAPGNAGGGSTDPNPASNDQNSGGGGGSNGGAGGTGGRSWFSNLDRGGRGAAVTPSFSQLVLGGGGGAGTRNNDNCGNNGATAADEGQAASGAAGGGLVLLRAASFAITAGATVTANGTAAYDETKNDGGGGGGAGGSVVLTVTSGTMSGLSVQANGGNGGSAWKTASGAVNPGSRHGPGGGGGGGVVAYTNSAGLPTVVVNGGLPGTTTTANDTFGAQPGAVGQTLFVAPGQIPGVGSASDCAPDPSIALTHTPATVASGGTVTFVATVSNAGPFIATSGTITVTIAIDAGLTPTAANGTGWACSVLGQTVTCTRSDSLTAHQSYPAISIGATAVAGGPTLLSNNTATVGGGGDINSANNTATDAVGISAPTLARLRSFQAVRFADAVYLSWQTSFESQNLGFRLYREVGGVRQPLTPSLIAGSALFVGRRDMTSGRSYAWVDRDARVASGVLYWLEDVDVDGTRQWTGPVVPQAPSGAATRRHGSVSNSPLLKGLGRPDAGRAGETIAEGLGIERRAQPKDKGDGNRPIPWWSPPSKPAAKILVQREGWYRVTKAEVIAAGYDPGTDPGTLRLLADGVEEPILVRDGGDGSFDSSDSIEFYGVGLDSPYDDAHVYWLVAGEEPGARIESLPWGSLPEAPLSFPFTVERKDRTVFFSALTTNGDAENFFGPVVTSDVVTQELALVHPDLASPGDSPLRVVLQGVTAGALHEVAVQVNGHDVGAIAFFGQEHPGEVFKVPNAWLQEGINQVTLVARDGVDDVSLVDSVQLTYPHLYRLDSGALRMTVPADSTATIPKLSDDSLRVIDLSNPRQPREVPVRWVREGPWLTAHLSVFGRDSATTLLAFTSARVSSPTAIVANIPSRLRARQNGADLVILAHPSLLASVKPLQALRQSQGLATQVIDLTDVYDEFAFGHKTPFAIRDFLRYADQAWGRRPGYALLVGDASFDPKDYLGMGSFDLLPTKLIPTAFMKTDSDDWFADFDGDSLPEMAIGRLPARTPAEASLMISKIVGRDSVPTLSKEPSRNSVLLVADQNDGFDFEAATEALRKLLPPDISTRQVFVGQLGGAAHGEIVSFINAGQLLVSYTGHGSEDVWSRSAVFSGADADALTNGTRLPVVVGMTCLNGLFDDLYVESLAEAFLKAPNGGAVAVWASSALTEPGPQATMNQELFRLLFQGPPITLGDAIVRAKAAVPDQDVRRTWILFGDPTMRLR